MLSEHATGDRVLELEPVTSVSEVMAAQRATLVVHTSERLLHYVVAVLTGIREDPRVELGASPRAGLMLVKAAKARAALQGRDHVLPDDIQDLVLSVLAHRLVLAPGAIDISRPEVLGDALERVPAL
jgi:MoxR-like ATPase